MVKRKLLELDWLCFILEQKIINPGGHEREEEGGWSSPFLQEGCKAGKSGWGPRGGGGRDVLRGATAEGKSLLCVT